MNQCAEIVSTARGRGNATPNARHERVKSLSSSVFIGEPWPMNAAGIGSISLIRSSCAKLTAFSRSHVILSPHNEVYSDDAASFVRVSRSRLRQTSGDRQ